MKLGFFIDTEQHRELLRALSDQKGTWDGFAEQDIFLFKLCKSTKDTKSSDTDPRFLVEIDFTEKWPDEEKTSREDFEWLLDRLEIFPRVTKYNPIQDIKIIGQEISDDDTNMPEGLAKFFDYYIAMCLIGRGLFGTKEMDKEMTPSEYRESMLNLIKHILEEFYIQLKNHPDPD